MRDKKFWGVITLSIIFLIIVFSGQYFISERYSKICLEDIGKDYCIEKNMEFRSISDNYYSSFICDDKDRKYTFVLNYKYTKEEKEGCKSWRYKWEK